MACRDPKERESRAFGHSAPLLPVAERVHADTERDRERLLRKTSEAPEGRDVISALELASHEAIAQAPWDGAREVGVRQLANVASRHAIGLARQLGRAAP